MKSGILSQNDIMNETDKDFELNPYLVRISTQEKIAIKSTVFRLGKKVGISDYIIRGNSTVSRIHADIIRKNNRFYICDNASTNGTFIFGVKLPPQQEVEIFDGDELKLANEKFEFHLV